MSSKTTAKRLLGVMAGKYKMAFGFSVVFIIYSTFANVKGSFFIQSLVDDFISPLLLESSPVFDKLLKAIVIMAVIYLTGLLCTLLYNQIMVKVSQGVQKQIREDTFSHMQTLPIKYFDTHTHGEVMSTYTNDIDTLREFFSQSLPQLLQSLFTIIIVTIMMLSLNIPLTLFVFVFVAIMIVLTRILGGKAGKHFIRQQKTLGNLSGYIEEMINGQKVVKIFSYETRNLAEFEDKNELLRKEASTANGFSNIIMSIVMNVGNLQYIAIAIVGGVLSINGIGNITMGTLIAFLLLSKSFSGPIGQISSQINAIITALAGANRIFGLLDEASETDEGYVKLVSTQMTDGKLAETDKNLGMWAWKHPHGDGTVTYTELKGDVRFYDVDFGYTSETLVLKNISLYAKPGHKIAFVGATGAGKTTITNLINRFYDIEDGKIRIDDININKIKKADLRSALGIVLQDTHLFSGTIRDNIHYGNLNASNEEIESAAILANADSFIQRLPLGYDTEITGDGGMLSNGQKQLVAIARAAVSNPPIMILDEATSSIDTHTEKLVQAGMDSLMRGRTVFVIAHRLSTIRNSNAIMVMLGGEIIERGNHDELLKKKGTYYELYTGNFEEHSQVACNTK